MNINPLAFIVVLIIPLLVLRQVSQRQSINEAQARVRAFKHAARDPELLRHFFLHGEVKWEMVPVPPPAYYKVKVIN